MKIFSKLITVSLILMLSVFISVTEVKSQPVIIPTAGFNISSIKYDLPDGETTPLAGYQVGANVRIGTSGFLELGAFYQQYSNNFKGIDTLTLEAFNTDIKISSVQIPIHFGFSVYDVDFLKIMLIAGINVNIPLDIQENDLLLLKDDLKGSNTQVAVGFGFDIYRFVLDANFAFAMNDLFEDPSKNSSVNMYTLNVGYIIGGR